MSFVLKRTILVPVVTAVATFALVVAAVWQLKRTETRRYQQEVRAATLQQIATVRANAESSVNKRAYLTLGLKAYVACHPDLDSAEFARIAALLMREGEGIRSVTLIKNNVITDVYPRAGNEQALGMRLLDEPAQCDAVRQAIISGKPWLAGPVELRQGGVAFVNRAPVFVEPIGAPTADSAGPDRGGPDRAGPDGTASDNSRSGAGPAPALKLQARIAVLPTTDAPQTESAPQTEDIDDAGQPIRQRGEYWGLVSILIDKETLMREIVRGVPDNIEVALRGKDGHGARGDYFHGAATIEGSNPLILDIVLPTGRWQVLGVPRGGWPTRAPVANVLDVAGTLAALLAAGSVFFILRTAARAREARQLAVEASVAKSAFLANMSHEIRTPMTAILGFAEVLEQLTTGAEAQAAVNTIQRNGQHLLGVINDILDLSKIEAGKLSVELIPCAPHLLLQEVIAANQIRAAEKGVQLQTRFDGPVPRTILSDPTRLRQVLLNLVGNALKFTHQGTITITLRLLHAESNEPMLQCDVEDTGIGMTQREIEALFQPFCQADASTTRKYGGTGLGLAISQRMVAILGGEILVRSMPGRGTKFSFSVTTGPLDLTDALTEPPQWAVLPVAPTATAGANSLSDPWQPPVGSADRQQFESVNQDLTTPRRIGDPGGPSHTIPARGPAALPAHGAPPQSLLGLRVLLAEDGLDNQRLVRYMLEKAGAEVEVVGNGREAIERVARDLADEACDSPLNDSSPGDDDSSSGPIDLVLMDMQMPVMDGYLATAELRRRGFAGPIIALTAHAMRDDERRCLEAGCNAYATKPINRRRLLQLAQQFGFVDSAK